MSKQEKAIDQILDLLLDALQERQQERGELANSSQLESHPSEAATIEPQAETIPNAEEVTEESTTEENRYAAAFRHVVDDEEAESESAALVSAGELDQAYAEAYLETPEKLPSINMNRVFYRLCVSLALLLIVVNVPFNRFGTNLARAMPDERALVVRDGLLFKGAGDEIYILENNQKRWISSLTAFEVSGFRWDQVHEVDQEFVDQFSSGPDFHVLIRCDAQPHIYLLEGTQKRWIENPVEFERAGFKWEDVRYIDCWRLKNSYEDGVPIPEDADQDRIPSW